MHTSKGPGSEVLMNCEAESANCLCKPTLTEHFLSFVGIPLDFLCLY